MATPKTPKEWTNRAYSELPERGIKEYSESQRRQELVNAFGHVPEFPVTNKELEERKRRQENEIHIQEPKGILYTSRDNSPGDTRNNNIERKGSLPSRENQIKFTEERTRRKTESERGEKETKL